VSIFPCLPEHDRFFEWQIANHADFVASSTTPLIPEIRANDFYSVLCRLYQHHSALRATFPGDDAMAVHDANSFGPDFAVEVLQSRPGEERTTEIAQLVAHLRRSIDLQHGPLACHRYLDTGNGHSPLLLTVAHHLQVDGVGAQILIQDLITGLGQALAGSPLILRPTSTTIEDVSVRLYRWARSDQAQKALSDWREVLGADQAPLPCRTGDGTGRIEHSVVVRRELPGESGVVTSLGQARIIGALLSVWAAEISHPRPWIQIIDSGRRCFASGPSLRRVVGWLSSAFPLPVRFRNVDSIDSCIDDVRQAYSNVPHRGSSFDTLRYLSLGGHERALLLPDAQVCFNFQGGLGTSDRKLFEHSLEAIQHSVGLKGQRAYALMIVVTQRRTRLEMHYEFDPAIISATAVDAWHEKFERQWSKLAS
jgi:hypothetical protein